MHANLITVICSIPSTGHKNTCEWRASAFDTAVSSFARLCMMEPRWSAHGMLDALSRSASATLQICVVDPRWLSLGGSYCTDDTHRCDDARTNNTPAASLARMAAPDGGTASLARMMAPAARLTPRQRRPRGGGLATRCRLPPSRWRGGRPLP
ncbi:hypothetical protein BDA96_03G100900 [Sorghum bicolor]|uniref:Uncharacterized protein n=2 Tax=Sorghum bicolor TaxID=4558 RepID=A0A921UPC8_SORBI|nr:hypothetical protein BDA96_03G100900 [Sorghum bicolor]OQU86476.1 hypothetical protein SORBI_3003G095750 [Sorghum bicolor]